MRYIALRPYDDQVASPGHRIRVQQDNKDDLVDISHEETLPERVGNIEAQRVTRYNCFTLTIDEAKWLRDRLNEVLK